MKPEFVIAMEEQYNKNAKEALELALSSVGLMYGDTTALQAKITSVIEDIDANLIALQDLYHETV